MASSTTVSGRAATSNNNPISHKYGETSLFPVTGTSVFLPPPAFADKSAWNAIHSYGNSNASSSSLSEGPSSSSLSYMPPPPQFDDWSYPKQGEDHFIVDMVDSYDGELFISRKATLPTRTNPWPASIWNPMERASSLSLTGRSPPERAPPIDERSGEFFGKQTQPYTTDGPDSPAPFDDGTYFEAAFSNSFPQLSQQQHWYQEDFQIPFESTSSLSVSSSSSSPSPSQDSLSMSFRGGGAFSGPSGLSSTQNLHKRHVQPTLSPIAPSTASISPYSSPSSSPELISPNSIPILQPRPYRRIPIISLSELASACGDWDAPPSLRRQTEKLSPPTSSLLTSPGVYPLSAYPRTQPLNSSRINTNNEYAVRGKYPNNVRYSGGIGVEGPACSCGCMESCMISPI